jgi:hypothetical protein
MLSLTRRQVEDLCSFVEKRIAADGCDHTHRFSREWAANATVAWDDLLDLLEKHGGHCDCEVVMNLPEDIDLTTKVAEAPAADGDPWRLPKARDDSSNRSFSRWIVCDAKVGRNTHALHGELLVPAPIGGKPRKRTRKSVSFFIGCDSGLPAEVGVVAECPPVSPETFAHRVRAAGIVELQKFGAREAAFTLSSVADLAAGIPVGTHYLELSGVAGKMEVLRVHKVAVGR